MAYNLSKASRDKLAGVHPRLVRVVERAITISSVDFKVICGVRTADEQMRLYGQGRTAAECARANVPTKYAKPKMQKVTWTLNSNHKVRPNTGFGHAVDLFPAPYDWKTTIVKGRQEPWDSMIDAMLEAARLEGVTIRSGADWDRDGNRREKGEHDSPHFELYE